MIPSLAHITSNLRPCERIKLKIIRNDEEQNDEMEYSNCLYDWRTNAIENGDSCSQEFKKVQFKPHQHEVFVQINYLKKYKKSSKKKLN